MLSIKFGGTSMGSKDSIKTVVEIIKERHKKGLVVTVSAMSGVTNKLLILANKAVKDSEVDKEIIDEIYAIHEEVVENVIEDAARKIKVTTYIKRELRKLKYFLEAIAITAELSTKSHDIIMALGEKFSACLLAIILEDQGVKAKYVNLENIIKKNYPEADRAFFREAESLLGKKLKKIIKEKTVPICTGFIGKVPGGILESVGRGYSDFTCALAGAGLKVKEIQIWTDVDGMLSADPRIVKDAHIIKKLSFREASELAHFGAKILHPQTIHPAVEAKIPVRILNTFNPQNTGTLIINDSVKSDKLFKSIAVKKNNIILRICSSRMLMHYGFVAKVFNIFGKYKISIDLIATSEVNISLSFEEKELIVNGCSILNELKAEIEELGKVYIYPNNAIISIVGQEVTHNTHLSSTIFSAIENANIDIVLISQGASQINLSFMVKDEDADKALKLVHDSICG